MYGGQKKKCTKFKARVTYLVLIMDLLMDGRTDGQTGGKTDGLLNGRTDGLRNGGMDEIDRLAMD